MNPIRPLGPAVKAEVAAELNGLPHARITEHDGAANVFTAGGLPELELWFMALGGDFREPVPAGPGVCIRTLDTDTDHGNGIPVRVYAFALDTDQLDAACADAVA